MHKLCERIVISGLFLTVTPKAPGFGWLMVYCADAVSRARFLMKGGSFDANWLYCIVKLSKLQISELNTLVQKETSGDVEGNHLLRTVFIVHWKVFNCLLTTYSAVDLTEQTSCHRQLSIHLQ
jgi:hypothetical protein